MNITLNRIKNIMWNEDISIHISIHTGELELRWRYSIPRYFINFLLKFQPATLEFRYLFPMSIICSRIRSKTFFRIRFSWIDTKPLRLIHAFNCRLKERDRLNIHGGILVLERGKGAIERRERCQERRRSVFVYKWLGLKTLQWTLSLTLVKCASFFPSLSFFPIPLPMHDRVVSILRPSISTFTFTRRGREQCSRARLIRITRCDDDTRLRANRNLICSRKKI